MAVLYSYGGFIAPMCPSCSDYSLPGGADHFIFRKDGVVYLVCSWVCMGTYCIAEDQFWVEHSGKTYALVDGAWVRQAENMPTNTYLTEASNVIWSEQDVVYKTMSAIWETGVFMAGSEPVALGDTGELVLEPLPESCPTVTAFGDTGITLGARVRSGDETYDISSEAVYTPREAYARVEETRQLVLLEEGYTGGDVTVDITWAQLPGQTVTLTVPVSINTSDEKKRLFWLGFGMGTGMYAGTLLPGTGETEADGTGEEAFWKGFACGAAMYGGA